MKGKGPLTKTDSLTIVEECIAQVPAAEVLLPNPETLTAGHLLLWFPLPPAYGRDLAVRLRLARPNRAGELWESLARDSGGLVKIYEATGSRTTVTTLAALLYTWGLLGSEIIRRYQRAPIGSLYGSLDDLGPPAFDALVQRLHAHRPLRVEAAHKAKARTEDATSPRPPGVGAGCRKGARPAGRA
jgi:hypothetical protein